MADDTTCSIDMLANDNCASDKPLLSHQNDRGETLVGGAALVGGFMYSLIWPASLGYKIGSGRLTDNLLEPIVSRAIPGVFMGSFAGICEMGWPGTVVGAVYLGVEALSFGAGYAVGHFTK